MTVQRLMMAGIVLLAGAVASAQDHDHGMHAATVAGTPQQPGDPALPPGEEQAKQALETTPRHGEWADVKVPGTKDVIRTWVMYPERKDKAPVVLVICEIYGLSDWLRAVADQLAEDGFIAIAPDLVSGKGPGGGGTESATSRDEVVRWVRELTPAEVTARLNAARAYGLGLPAANGKTATVGFCWGGSQSFAYACAQPELNAAVVYYGTSPDSSALMNLNAPVLGLYGGDDARVNMTIEPAKKVLEARKKTYETEIYEGAGHGFLRAQSGRDGANLKATMQAWPRTVAFLKKHTN